VRPRGPSASTVTRSRVVEEAAIRPTAAVGCGGHSLAGSTRQLSAGRIADDPRSSDVTTCAHRCSDSKCCTSKSHVLHYMGLTSSLRVCNARRTVPPRNGIRTNQLRQNLAVGVRHLVRVPF
jgi:hypothetical protein